jgi:hypothetical protein
LGDKRQSAVELPLEPSGLQIPKKILDKRMITHGTHSVVHVLIQWSSAPASMATWEDFEALKQRLPLVPTWGQPTPKDGGDVTTAIPDTGLVGGKLPRDEVVGWTRSGRIRRPNRRVFGREWMSGVRE